MVFSLLHRVCGTMKAFAHSDRPDDRRATPVALIVDDQPGTHERFTAALSGAHLVHSADSDEALRLLRSRKAIDLLVTAVDIPGRFDGQGLARQAQALRRDLKVLYLGAAGRRPARHDHARDLGEWLTPPFTDERIRRAVTQALARRSERGSPAPAAVPADGS
jgi:CheY-like chemotaxis protein